MKAYAAGRKPFLFECYGDSQTWFEDGAVVIDGDLKQHGTQIPEKPGMVAVHRCSSLTEYTRDGVKVELITDRELKQQKSG
jgi:hypothetical protein